MSCKRHSNVEQRLTLSVDLPVGLLFLGRHFQIIAFPMKTIFHFFFLIVLCHDLQAQLYRLNLSRTSLGNVFETTENEYVATGWFQGETFWDSIGFYEVGEGIALVKFSENGDTLWSKVYSVDGHNEYSLSESSVYTSNGDFMISGGCYSCDETGNHLLLLRTDANGDTLWTKGYGFGSNKNLRARDIVESHDGNFVVSGEIGLIGDSSSAFIMKVDPTGNVIWAKSLSSSFSGQAFSVLEDQDDAFVICGRVNVGTGNSDVLVAKLSSDGNLIWAKTFGRESDDYAFSMCHAHQGGFIISGGISNKEKSRTDILISSITGNGIVQWTKAIGEVFGDAHCISQVEDGYLAGGWTSDFGIENADYFLMQLNSNGDINWYRTYNDEYGLPQHLIETSDGRYLAAGSHLELAKFDASGITGCESVARQPLVQNIALDTTSNILELNDIDLSVFSTSIYILSGLDWISRCEMVGLEETKNEEWVTIYSNLVTDQLEFDIHKPFCKKIVLYDLNGKIIYQQPGMENSTNLNIKISFFPAGMYILKIFFRDGEFVKRLIKI